MSPPAHNKAMTTRKANRNFCSVLFRSNYAMLGAVFAGAFGFQMCASPRWTRSESDNVMRRDKRG